MDVDVSMEARAQEIHGVFLVAFTLLFLMAGLALVTHRARYRQEREELASWRARTGKARLEVRSSVLVGGILEQWGRWVAVV